MQQNSNHSTLSLEIHSRTELLADVRDFVTHAARQFGFDETDVGKIELAVDEACTNIIKHAYKFDPEGMIQIRIAHTNRNQKGKFAVTILDTGAVFDVRHYSKPDMKDYFAKLRKGGLGIVLMYKLMDEVEYGFSPDKKNSITLVKYLIH